MLGSTVATTVFKCKQHIYLPIFHQATTTTTTTSDDINTPYFVWLLTLHEDEEKSTHENIFDKHGFYVLPIRTYIYTRFRLSMAMSRLTRDRTAEPVSRDQIFRRERRQENIHSPCSADHEQDWQPYPVDLYSRYMCDDTYIHSST